MFSSAEENVDSFLHFTINEGFFVEKNLESIHNKKSLLHFHLEGYPSAIKCVYI